MPETGERDDSVAIREGEPSLTPTSYDIQESRSCTLSGQHNRANLVSSGVGESDLNEMSMRELHHFLRRHG